MKKLKNMDKDIFVILILIAFLFFAINCFLVGYLNKNYMKPSLEDITRDNVAYMKLAKEQEDSLNASWANNSSRYPLRYVYSADSKDFVVLLDLSEKDYSNFVKYKANISVSKTWDGLVEGLQNISTAGHNIFLNKGYAINYYFNVTNPKDRKEYLVVINNGDVIKNVFKD